MHSHPESELRPLSIAVYHGLPLGGARRAAFEQARRLATDHSVTFFGLGDVDQPVMDLRQYCQVGRVEAFRPSKLLQSPWGRLNAGLRIADLWRLRRLSMPFAQEINRGDYDVVLVHPCQYAHVPWLLRFLTKPVVYYCHEHNRLIHEPVSPARGEIARGGWRAALDTVDPLHQGYRRLIAGLERRGLGTAQRVLVNSRYTQSRLATLLQVDSQVAYLGVDTTAFEARFRRREDFVLSVGALTPTKGFDLIVLALAHVPDDLRPSFVLVGFGGSEEERSYLEQLARANGVHLEIRLGVSHEDLVDLYNRTRLVAYTPIGEPFGLVPLEAMACGTAVVGVAEGGLTETIQDHVTGRLVPRDAAALGAVLAQLLRSPAQCEAMGHAGRRIVEQHWTWSSAMVRLEHHLREVVQAAPPDLAHRSSPSLARASGTPEILA